jgi:hypothetical protein
MIDITRTNDIWLLGDKYQTYMKLSEDVGKKNGIEVNHFINIKATKNADAAIGIFGGHLGPTTAPAQLILRLKDFDVDYFKWGGPMFVSERMRDVMALDPSEVNYIEVDDSKSARLPRSKKYQMMEPLIYEDMIDPERSVYWEDPNLPSSEFGPYDIYKFAFRQDAAPTHDIFYDSFFATFVFCSDQLAERLLKAGCTGLDFTDPRGYAGSGVRRRRTVDGIEIYGQKEGPEMFEGIGEIQPELKAKYDWIIAKFKELGDD